MGGCLISVPSMLAADEGATTPAAETAQTDENQAQI